MRAEGTIATVPMSPGFYPLQLGKGIIISCKYSEDVGIIDAITI